MLALGSLGDTVLEVLGRFLSAYEQGANEKRSEVEGYVLLSSAQSETVKQLGR